LTTSPGRPLWLWRWRSILEQSQRILSHGSTSTHGSSLEGTSRRTLIRSPLLMILHSPRNKCTGLVSWPLNQLTPMHKIFLLSLNLSSSLIRSHRSSFLSYSQSLPAGPAVLQEAVQLHQRHNWKAWFHKTCSNGLPGPQPGHRQLIW
jgi:hypothetical protein